MMPSPKRPKPDPYFTGSLPSDREPKIPSGFSDFCHRWLLGNGANISRNGRALVPEYWVEEIYAPDEEVA